MPDAAERVRDDLVRIPLPIPFEVGPLNCYLLLGSEPALVDTGPKTDEAFALLVERLRELDCPPARLRHIFVTHAHVDHHGNLARLAALAPDAVLHAHEADAPQIFEHDAMMVARVAAIRELVVTWGYPQSVIPFVERAYLGFGRFADTVDRARFEPLAGSACELELGGRRIRALHCPGHTEGLVCLFLPERGGALLSSDHILERITPNPTVYLTPFRGRRTGLRDYLESLRAVRDLPAEVVLPGHGPPFHGLAARVDRILEHHEQRAGRIERILAARERATVLEVALGVWENLTPADYYLACREVDGHLDILIERARALRAIDAGGVARYSLARAGT